MPLMSNVKRAQMRCTRAGVLAALLIGCTPSPAPLRVSPTGVGLEGCANNDGPAVEFVFRVENDLPTASFKDAGNRNPTVTFGPPLVGNQELRVRVNAILTRVKDLRRWTIGNPDSDGGLLAWICPVGGYPCDFATTGTVRFTRAVDDIVDGQTDLTFQSMNVVTSAFSAKLVTQSKPRVGIQCG